MYYTYVQSCGSVLVRSPQITNNNYWINASECQAWVFYLLTQLESVLSADLITAILTVDQVALPGEFTGMHWSAVADFFTCSVVEMLRQVTGGDILTSIPGAVVLF